VYPKTIDVAVPLLFLGLLPPAILYTEVTHRYVFLAINGWLLAVMTVRAGRAHVGQPPPVLLPSSWLTCLTQ
jgi:hypothetical protein